MLPPTLRGGGRGPDPVVFPLSEELHRQQQRIRALAEMLSTGIEPTHSIFGLIRVDARPLSAEDRVETLFELVRRYEEARERLKAQRGLWSECLAHLGPRLSAAVAPRAERLRQLERKRTHLEVAARQGNDAELLERTATLRGRLEASLRVLAAVVVALVRRADAVRQTLAGWDGSEREQADLLARLRERAAARAEVLQLEREVHELEDARAGQALPGGPAALFDDLFQPLNRGLETAREADERLQALVGELLGLAFDLEAEASQERIGPAERQAAEALLRAPVEANALVAQALAAGPAPATEDQAPAEALEHRLRKVETALDHGCLAAFGEEAYLRRAQRAKSPYVWRDYLHKFPQAAGAAEARTALEALDAAALANAERAGSRHWWWSYLRDFPEGPDAARARAALEKMPPPAPDAAALKRLAACPEGSVFLGDLPALSCQVGWGNLRINEGGEVRVLGERCDRFVFPHPPARVRWAVPEGATRFTAIGTRIDAREAAHGTWRYEVRLDERSVLRSGPLHDQPDGIPIELALPQGSRVLEVVIDDYGDGHYDWAVLAYPAFHRA